jgi:hypothetical protein
MAVEPVITSQPNPCNLPWPDHEWDDPDNDGHQCAGCGADSVWKCDPAAHQIGEHLRGLGIPEGRIHLAPKH